jgi:hypothetical protein
VARARLGHVFRGRRSFSVLAFLLTAVVVTLLAVQFGHLDFSSTAKASCNVIGEPTVVTDKDDYQPEETVQIDGCGFESYEGQTLTVRVTRPDNVQDSAPVTVSLGKFSYGYVLDGILGSYTIEVLDSGSNVITGTTFTDHTGATVLIRDTSDAFGADSYTTDSFGVTLDITWTGSPDVNQARFLNDPTPETGCPAFVAEPWLPISEIGTSNTATFPWTVLGSTDTGLRRVCSQTAHGAIIGVPDPGSIISHDDTIFFRRPNPVLSQSCGLDIAVVMDNSSSIDAAELATMKTAINGFVTALMPETPTEMSLVTFNTSASLAQTFTASEATMTAAVNAVGLSAGFTNWDDGLAAGRALLPHRASKADLIIIASDGNPNRRGGHTALTHSAGVAAVSEQMAMAWATAEANQAKVDGDRILAIGIGADLDTSNLIAISGTSVHPPDPLTTNTDVITSDFGTLASDMADLVGELCPGNVFVHKTIDNDGNLGTTGDQSPGVGWTFTCTAAPDTCTPGSAVTDGTGNIPGDGFEIDTGPDDSASVTITETVMGGFGFLSANCVKNMVNVGTPGSAQVSAIPVAPGDIVNCTFYNTPAAYITVNKACVPPSDTGLFNLLIDGTTYGADKPCGGTTGPVLVTPGAHVVSETAGSGTNLANYDTVIGGDCAANGSVTVAGGETKTCTITNTRKPTLTVNKVCNPPSDTGLFNLRIDGTTYAANAPCGGTTGAIVLNIGAHTVSETAGTGTNLADYSVTIGGDCNGAGSVTLAAGENKTCTITNLKLPKLTVNKVCVPPSDPGLFNLRIDGTTYATDAPCGGTTGPVVLTVGPHTVSETAGTGTNLANYDTVIGGDCAANGSITLAAGDNKTCSVTNTRKPTLTVNKVCVPPSDTGLFNLIIDGTTQGANKPCGGSTGAVLLSTGLHTVSETAGSGTNLADYAVTIGGDCAANGTITLAAGENKTCTITNERLGTIIIHKDAKDGANDNPPQDFSFNCTGLGNFQLDDDGANGNPLDDTKTFVGVTPGDYDCTENAVSGWLISISCNDPDSETTVTPPTAQIDVDGGETVECTFTNTFVPGSPVVGGITGLIEPTDPARPASGWWLLLATSLLPLAGLATAGTLALARRRNR